VFPLPQSVSVPFVRSDAIDVGTQCCESPAVTPVKFPFHSAPCPFRSSDTVCCEDPPCSVTSEVPPTCSVLDPQVTPFMFHFEFGPSPVPLPTDHDQSDPVFASQVVSEQRSFDSSFSCQETSPLPFVRDHDHDVALLKSHFYPGGPEVPIWVPEPCVEGAEPFSTIDDLPQHVTQLFLDTFELADFPVEATNGLKQL